MWPERCLPTARTFPAKPEQENLLALVKETWLDRPQRAIDYLTTLHTQVPERSSLLLNSLQWCQFVCVGNRMLAAFASICMNSIDLQALQLHVDHISSLAKFRSDVVHIHKICFHVSCFLLLARLVWVQLFHARCLACHAYSPNAPAAMRSISLLYICVRAGVFPAVCTGWLVEVFRQPLKRQRHRLDSSPALQFRQPTPHACTRQMSNGPSGD